LKDIADQNPATTAIRLQVKKVILETNKFSLLDLATGLGYYISDRLKRGKMSTKSLREPVKTRPNSFFKK
jgi:hypothetical protein